MDVCMIEYRSVFLDIFGREKCARGRRSIYIEREVVL